MKVRVISVYPVRLKFHNHLCRRCFWNLIYMCKYFVQSSLFSDRDKLLNSHLIMSLTLRASYNTRIKFNKFITLLILV